MKVRLHSNLMPQGTQGKVFEYEEVIVLIILVPNPAIICKFYGQFAKAKNLLYYLNILNPVLPLLISPSSTCTDFHSIFKTFVEEILTVAG